MSKLKIAVIQTSFTENREENVSHLTQLIRKAAQNGARVMLTPELFETPYFPRETNREFFSLARPVKDNPTLRHFQLLAKELKVILPISFFEKDGDHYYNSLAFMDDKGDLKGIYRKTFIPSGPGYEEKFYFRSGDTGFRVWETPYGRIGVGICWDQWFPEAARAMVLQGADVLLYPTCIGSEPANPNLDTKDPWQRVMIGHAVANVIPVAAANRIGTEGGQTYYGSSFIADHRGNFVAQASRTEEEILYAEIDIDQIRLDREDFGLLQDLKKWQALQKLGK